VLQDAVRKSGGSRRVSMASHELRLVRIRDGTENSLPSGVSCRTLS